VKTRLSGTKERKSGVGMEEDWDVYDTAQFMFCCLCLEIGQGRFTSTDGKGDSHSKPRRKRVANFHVGEGVW
jgi:hypothetical protein